MSRPEGGRPMPARQLAPLVAYLDHWARLTPDAEAVVDLGCRLSYAELAGYVDRCARAFLAAGVEPGERIAMLTTPRLEFMIALLAMSRIGAVFVGLNPRHRLRELQYILADSAPRLLISIERFEGRLYSEELQALAAQRSLLAAPLLIGDEQPDVEFYAPLELRSVSDEELTAVAAKAGAAGALCIVYTSGSTGAPKGAVLSDHGLVASHLRWLEHLQLEGVRTVSDLGVDHIGGLERLLLTLPSGGTVIFQRRFDPQVLLELLARERATFWFAEISQLIRCAPLLDRYELSSLQAAGWAGAPLSTELLAQMRRVAPLLFTGYGMTETSNALMLTDRSTAPQELTSSHVGKPLAGVMTRLVSPDGEILGRGGEGLLEVRSDLVFLGYLNRAEATAGTFTADGWFRTGDLLRERDDGSFDFLGRAEEMYKSGGYNIYPREIESVLAAHPQVGEVAVIAVPDELYQTVGHAFVEPLDGGVPPDPQQLRGWCAQRLANYKVPKAIVVLERLPRLRNERVDKVALSQLALADPGQPR